VRMNRNGPMYMSKETNYWDTPRGWEWDRFRPVMLMLPVNSIIALHSTKHNRFVRMNGGNGRMGASEPQSWNSFTSHWKWERFRVVDAGNGEIALHCARFNRFVKMHSDGYMEYSVEKNWHDFPSEWTWERFRVVDAGKG